jgi:hypothetical protein
LIFPGARVVLVLCCPHNGRSSPAPGAPILNLPCRVGARHRRRRPRPAVPRRRDGPVADDGRLRIRHPRRPGPPAWQEGRWASMNGVRRPGAKRSPARWRRYDTWREAQDSPAVSTKEARATGACRGLGRGDRSESSRSVSRRPPPTAPADTTFHWAALSISMQSQFGVTHPSRRGEGPRMRGEFLCTGRSLRSCS